VFKRFHPDIVVDSFIEITPEFLAKKRIQALLIDIDNTLVDYQTKEPTEEVIAWLENLKDHGIKLCIFSNASKERVEAFSKDLGVPAIHRAGKPSTKRFIKALELIKAQPYQSAMIGDQIFTDVYGGKRSSMFSIWVRPITKKEIIHVKLKRVAEKLVLFNFERKKK
jgi:uncharacterized protein